MIPLALMTSESIVHSAFGLMGYYLRAHSGSGNNCSVALHTDFLGKIFRKQALLSLKLRFTYVGTLYDNA